MRMIGLVGVKILSIEGHCTLPLIQNEVCTAFTSTVHIHAASNANYSLWFIVMIVNPLPPNFMPTIAADGTASPDSLGGQ